MAIPVSQALSLRPHLSSLPTSLALPTSSPLSSTRLPANVPQWGVQRLLSCKTEKRRPHHWRASLRASSSPSVYTAGTLGEVSVFSAATEDRVMFKDLWDQEEGVAVVALLRHFGCPCCWELASTLKDAKSTFDSASVKLIAVGVGTTEKARMLADRLPFPLECLYADPDRKAYETLDLYYGFARTFLNPASVKVFSRAEALKKATKNYTIKATPDDASGVLQQGGMFVFKGKELLYYRKDEGTGDHAPLDAVFKYCCS